jgi:hypothetical protein
MMAKEQQQQQQCLHGTEGATRWQRIKRLQQQQQCSTSSLSAT